VRLKKFHIKTHSENNYECGFFTENHMKWERRETSKSCFFIHIENFFSCPGEFNFNTNFSSISEINFTSHAKTLL